MIRDIIKKAKTKMRNCLDLFIVDINKINAGKANPKILENILVDYYGTKTPLCKISSISFENFHTLKISLFDINIVQLVQKAILCQNLDLNPIIEKNIIRVYFPPLTEERRKNLVKVVFLKTEKSKIHIRMIRKKFNNYAKEIVKTEKLGEDQLKIAQKNIQLLTDKYINEISSIFSIKKKELINL